MKTNKVIFSVLLGIFLQYSALGNTQDVVIVKLDSIEKYDVDWKDISTLMIKFFELGYVNIQINEIKYEYIPPSSEYVPKKQEHDIISFLKGDYDYNLVEQWCLRNKGKFAEITFGNRIKYSTILEITNLFHKHQIKFYLQINLPDGIDIDIDLYVADKPSHRRLTKLRLPRITPGDKVYELGENHR